MNNYAYMSDEDKLGVLQLLYYTLREALERNPTDPSLIEDKELLISEGMLVYNRIRKQ